MDGGTTARLALWRELRARAPWLALLGLLLVLEPLLPERSRGPWAWFGLLLVLPAASIGLGLGGRGETDSFWRGLGGSPRVREGTRALVHLTALLLVWIALTLSASARGDGLDELLGIPRMEEAHAALCFVLWSLTFAGRAHASGAVALVPLLTAVGVLGLGTALWSGLERWPLVSSTLVRVETLGVLGLLAGVQGAAVGAWGGAVRRRGFRLVHLSSTLAGLVLVSFVVELLFPVRWAPLSRWYAAPDGSSAMLLPEPGHRWGMGMSRGALWDGQGLSWHRGDPWAVTLGPSGSRFTPEEGFEWADGRKTRCGLLLDEVREFAVDGLSAVGRQAGSRLTTPEWWAPVLATPDGCQVTPKDVVVAWPLEDGVVFTRHEGADPVSGTGRVFSGVDVASAREVELPEPRGFPNLNVQGGVAYVALKHGDAHVVGRIGDGAFEELFRSEEWYALHAESDEPCAYTNSSRRRVCFDQDGSVFARAEGPADDWEALPGGWLWETSEHRLRRPRDGVTVPLPETEDAFRPSAPAVRITGTGDARYFGPDRRVYDVELPK